MKQISLLVFLLLVLLSCKDVKRVEQQATDLQGTWQLVSGTLIEKGDTTVTNYTSDPQMIKVINQSHFAFLNHDLKKGKDSLKAQFAAGGGRYELKGDQYTEHLEYCSDRVWEGNDFVFTVAVKNDTLIQMGVEKIAETDVNRWNVERYVRVR